MSNLNRTQLSFMLGAYAATHSPATAAMTTPTTSASVVAIAPSQPSMIPTTRAPAHDTYDPRTYNSGGDASHAQLVPMVYYFTPQDIVSNFFRDNDAALRAEGVVALQFRPGLSSVNEHGMHVHNQHELGVALNNDVYDCIYNQNQIRPGLQRLLDELRLRLLHCHYQVRVDPQNIIFRPARPQI